VKHIVSALHKVQRRHLQHMRLLPQPARDLPRWRIKGRMLENSINELLGRPNVQWEYSNSRRSEGMSIARDGTVTDTELSLTPATTESMNTEVTSTESSDISPSSNNQHSNNHHKQRRKSRNTINRPGMKFVTIFCDDQKVKCSLCNSTLCVFQN
jgi:hypothetical protein